MWIAHFFPYFESVSVFRPEVNPFEEHLDGSYFYIHLATLWFLIEEMSLFIDRDVLNASLFSVFSLFL